jgi:hypothetical protein
VGNIKYRPLGDVDWLYSRYILDGMTASEIEEEYGFHHSSVERAIKRFGLKRKHSSVVKCLRHISEKVWDGIKKRYIDGESGRSIAKSIGCTESTMLRHLKNRGVEIRNQREVASAHCKAINKLPVSDERKKKLSVAFSKEKNPQWMGGLSYQPYGVGFDEQKREQIRERDGRSCLMCHEKENGKKLHVHHVDYNKSNNDTTNLVSLCHHCHGLTAHDRERWVDYFSKEWGNKECQI